MKWRTEKVNNLITIYGTNRRTPESLIFSSAARKVLISEQLPVIMYEQKHIAVLPTF